ncbi:extracellular solute-binding protein [Clostridium oryzae]|nr:extracellular solute-binding protein [Clostridium oryzae]
MKKIAKIISIIVTLCILLSGCSKKINKNRNITKITMFSEDANRDDDGFQNPVAKEITEKTGISLDIQYPTINVIQQIKILVAGKEYPDLIFAKGANLDTFINAGAMRDLTPLINKYAPNLKKLYKGKWNTMQYSEKNKAIYALDSVAVDDKQLQPSMGFELQNAVVRELGYPKMRTVKDFENALIKYKRKHPSIDGKPTIALSLLTSDWYWDITLGNGATFALGEPDDGNWYVDPKTYKVEYKFARSNEKQYYKWLNHMNNMGLLDPDSFVQKPDEYISKIASGRVLGLIDAKWDYCKGEDILRTEGKFERTYGMYPVQLTKHTKAADFKSVKYSGSWGIGISTSCKDPAKVIKFLDWMASDEGQILRNWGVKGKNYNIVNGKRKLTDKDKNDMVNDNDYKRRTGIGAYLYPFPRWGSCKKDSTGQYYSTTNKQSIIDSYSSIEKEVLKGYGVKMWKDLYPSSRKFKVSPWGKAFMLGFPSDSASADKLNKCEKIAKEELIEMVLNSPDNFDKDWNNFVKKLKANGVEQVNKKFTKILRNRMKLDNR